MSPSVFFLRAIGCLCLAVSSHASATSVYDSLRLSSGDSWDGQGFIKYNGTFVESLIEAWVEPLHYCDHENPNDPICESGLEFELELRIPIIDAKFEAYGFVFDTADFEATWNLSYYDWSTVYITAFGAGTSNYLLFAASTDGDPPWTGYSINGFSGGSESDNGGFIAYSPGCCWGSSWRTSNPISEPGTLALLGLGLTGLGLSRRRKAA